MSGKKVHNYLKNRGSDGFYELYHELSECLISRSSLFKGYVDLVVHLCKTHPDFQASPEVRAELDESVDLSQQVTKSIRELFWPVRDGQNTHEWKVQLKRWEPFDETAWDAIPPHLAIVLQTVLPPLDKFPTTAITWSSGLVFEKASVEYLLHEFVKLFEELPRWAIPEWIEYRLLIHSHLDPIKNSCSLLYSRLDRLKEACNNHASLLAELDALIKQDEAFYLSLRPYFWPGTFGDPDGEPADNRWYPYNESEWDAAVAQVLDLSHSFVQVARQHCGNIQKSLPTNLPRLEEVQGTLRLINSQLDYVSSSATALEVDP